VNSSWRKMLTDGRPLGSAVYPRRVATCFSLRLMSDSRMESKLYGIPTQPTAILFRSPRPLERLFTTGMDWNNSEPQAHGIYPWVTDQQDLLMLH
jgi:hypothetical protein